MGITHSNPTTLLKGPIPHSSSLRRELKKRPSQEELGVERRGKFRFGEETRQVASVQLRQDGVRKRIQFLYKECDECVIDEPLV
jgi:hypothetical protein